MLATLIFCNIMWSGSYAMAKGLMAHYLPMEVAFLRFFSAGLPLLIYGLAARPRGKPRSLLVAWARDLKLLDVRLVVVGLLTFFISPFCQMQGLHLSRATDTALMIAVEPLVTILAAVLMLGERLRATHLISLALAFSGASIVSDVSWSKLRSFTDSRLVGNSIFLVSMFSEAAYSAVAKPVLDRRSPVLFLTVSIWVGIAFLFAYNVATGGVGRLAGLTTLVQRADPADFGAIFFLGPGCTLFGYLFWMSALRDTPVSIMAITLYLQPVLGVVWGHFLLHESFTLSTLLGGTLLLVAVWLGSRPRRG